METEHQVGSIPCTASLNPDAAVPPPPTVERLRAQGYETERLVQPSP